MLFSVVLALVVSTLALSPTALGTTTPATAAPPADRPQPWHLPLSRYADAPARATLPTGAAARTNGTAVGVSPASGNQETRFLGTGTGFTAGSTVRIAVTRPDGQPYTGSYPQTKTADGAGSFTWSWIWATGDPLGTYTYTATDVSGTVVQTTFTIVSGTGPPPAPAGSELMFDRRSSTAGRRGCTPPDGAPAPMEPRSP
jgi:hypothetical protein